MARFAPHKRGTLNHNAKLDRAKVLYIRASTRSNQALARELGVSKAAISNVRTGRTWSWLTSDAGATETAVAEAVASAPGVSHDAPELRRSPDACAAPVAPHAPGGDAAPRTSHASAPEGASGVPRDATAVAHATTREVRLSLEARASAASPRRPEAVAAARTTADASSTGVTDTGEVPVTKAAGPRARVAGHVGVRDTGTRAADSVTPPLAARASRIDARAADVHVLRDRVRVDDERRVANGSTGA